MSWSTVSDIIRAAGLNLWDVSMWFRRGNRMTKRRFDGKICTEERMREVNIGAASEFDDPGRKVIDVESFEVGVFKLGGEFFAYLNHCPHMGGPACQGKMMPKVEEVIADDRTSKGMAFSKTQINIVCPWHGYRIRHPHRRPSPAIRRCGCGR